jgi:hypothetical protein
MKKKVLTKRILSLILELRFKKVFCVLILAAFALIMPNMAYAQGYVLEAVSYSEDMHGRITLSSAPIAVEQTDFPSDYFHWYDELVIVTIRRGTTITLDATTLRMHSPVPRYNAHVYSVDNFGIDYLWNEGDTHLTWRTRDNLLSSFMSYFAEVWHIGDYITEFEFDTTGMFMLYSAFDAGMLSVRFIGFNVVDDSFQPVAPPLPVETPDGISVILDGTPLSFDVPPQIINGRTMVPLRAIFEAMGATIEWDGATQTATATRGNTIVVLTVGDASPTVNGMVVPLDQPGIIVGGRTLAPLRFIAEAFGGTVEWDGATQTATINCI